MPEHSSGNDYPDLQQLPNALAGPVDLFSDDFHSLISINKQSYKPGLIDDLSSQSLDSESSGRVK
jgi:hypothetical protein